MTRMDFHAIKCCNCGRVFTALSNQARYCSDACRSQAYRVRRRYDTSEPVRGLSGNAALMFADIASASPESARLIQAIRDKRGLSAARDAVYVAIATLFPGVADKGMETYDFYYREIPDYLKEKESV